mmetsp:Transcript_37549/g.54992  ORF Transcript_37549/g.54992 Transcript_37549/m.54992 type:complete len:274 (+) Transcript_37549:54-875(+)
MMTLYPISLLLFVLTTTSPSSAFIVSNQRKTTPTATTKTIWKATRLSSSTSNEPTPPQPQQQNQPVPVMLQPTNTDAEVAEATSILANFDTLQQKFIQTENQGWGGGTSALHFLQNLTPDQREEMKKAVLTLTQRANYERSFDSSHGRIMMGFCCANAYEALAGLKSWVPALNIPRGLLHGMDIDGVPQPLENFGCVYVKYSTGGAMTFSDMRKSGKGFDALWKPGDALLETYDGDFRGVYLNLELEDGVFRQFGVLPTDLFMEQDDDDEWDD